MVHEYRDVAAATDDAAPPDARTPAIAAFTPHLDGKFGVTIAEFPVEWHIEGLRGLAMAAAARSRRSRTVEDPERTKGIAADWTGTR